MAPFSIEGASTKSGAVQDMVRFEIGRLATDAGTPMESKDRARLREHLEAATGLTIAELAESTKRWPA